MDISKSNETTHHNIFNEIKLFSNSDIYNMNENEKNAILMKIRNYMIQNGTHAFDIAENLKKQGYDLRFLSLYKLEPVGIFEPILHTKDK